MYTAYISSHFQHTDSSFLERNETFVLARNDRAIELFLDQIEVLRSLMVSVANYDIVVWAWPLAMLSH